LHRARRGAAPEPSGLTAEIAKILLEDPPATQVCGRLAQANVPPAIAQAFGLGRLVALQKRSRGAGAVEETYCTSKMLGGRGADSLKRAAFWSIKSSVLGYDIARHVQHFV